LLYCLSWRELPLIFEARFLEMTATTGHYIHAL
jgi:hypothetical protein